MKFASSKLILIAMQQQMMLYNNCGVWLKAGSDYGWLSLSFSSFLRSSFDVIINANNVWLSHNILVLLSDSLDRNLFYYIPTFFNILSCMPLLRSEYFCRKGKVKHTLQQTTDSAANTKHSPMVRGCGASIDALTWDSRACSCNWEFRQRWNSCYNDEKGLS